MKEKLEKILKYCNFATQKIKIYSAKKWEEHLNLEKPVSLKDGQQWLKPLHV